MNVNRCLNRYMKTRLPEFISIKCWYWTNLMWTIRVQYFITVVIRLIQYDSREYTYVKKYLVIRLIYIVSRHNFILTLTASPYPPLLNTLPFPKMTPSHCFPILFAHYSEKCRGCHPGGRLVFQKRYRGRRLVQPRLYWNLFIYLFLIPNFVCHFFLFLLLLLLLFVFLFVCLFFFFLVFFFFLPFWRIRHQFLVFILVDLDRGDQDLYIGSLLLKIYGGCNNPP